jgi:2,3-bisphosphoglycerate-independent phosphoglycerate mutase
VAARANFCTLDAKGIVTDRRAGRIDTSVCAELCGVLSQNIKKIEDVEVIIKPGKGHRFVIVFRGKGMEGPLTDADPHREGLPIPTAEPVDEKSAKAKKTAKIVAQFYKQALPLIAKKKPANGFLVRGIAHQPAIPTFEDRYKLRAACIAIYPMYKGLASSSSSNSIWLSTRTTISSSFITSPRTATGKMETSKARRRPSRTLMRPCRFYCGKSRM